MADLWYSEGLDNAEKVAKDEAIEKERRRNMPRRFFVKEGFQATVMFIDENGFNVWEHIPFVQGKMDNQFTCGQPQGLPCAGCEKQVWKRYHSFFTILDLTEHQGQNGVVKNERRLLVGPPDFALLVKNWKAQPDAPALNWKSGVLRGRKFQVFRAQGVKDNIASGGWTPIPEPPMTKAQIELLRDGLGNPVFPKNAVAFDYKAILAPLPYDQQLQRLIGHVSKNWDKNKKPQGPQGAGTAPVGAPAAAAAQPTGGPVDQVYPSGATPQDDVLF